MDLYSAKKCNDTTVLYHKKSGVWHGVKQDDKFKELFAELIRTQLGLFRKIAFQIVNSYADADDAVQTALIRAWAKRSCFHGDPGALSSWVQRIIVSVSYDLLRKRMRDHRKHDHLQILESVPENHDPDLEMLDRAIAELPELYRETVHLAVLSGLSGEDAAKTLGCSANTLYQRIHKAKKLLLNSMRRRKNE